MGPKRKGLSSNHQFSSANYNWFQEGKTQVLVTVHHLKCFLQRTRLDLPKPLHFFTPCSASRNHFLHAQRSGGYSPPISWESTDSTLKTPGRPVLVQPPKKGKPGRRIASFLGGVFCIPPFTKHEPKRQGFCQKNIFTHSINSNSTLARKNHPNGQPATALQVSDLGIHGHSILAQSIYEAWTFFSGILGTNILVSWLTYFITVCDESNTAILVTFQLLC